MRTSIGRKLGKTKRALQLAALIGLSAWSGSTTFANLVVDGDFETPSLTPSWNISSPTTVSLADFGQGHGPSAWFAYMTSLVYDGPPPPNYSPATLSQSIVLQGGVTYSLSFWAHGDYLTTTYPNGGLTVTLDSAPTSYFLPSSSLTGNTPADWKEYTTTFTPTGSGNLLFSYQDTANGLDGGAVGRGIYLDDISLTAVPEPGTVIAGILLLLPFGARGLRLLRQRNA